MLVKDIKSKLLCFSADGVSIFQGCQTRVTVQIQHHHPLYVVNVHYIVHYRNLAITAIFGLDVISKFKDLLVSLNSYFSKIPKHQIEFTKLAEILETKGQKILKHVKMKSISL